MFPAGKLSGTTCVENNETPDEVTTYTHCLGSKCDMDIYGKNEFGCFYIFYSSLYTAIEMPAACDDGGSSPVPPTSSTSVRVQKRTHFLGVSTDVFSCDKLNLCFVKVQNNKQKPTSKLVILFWGLCICHLKCYTIYCTVSNKPLFN